MSSHVGAVRGPVCCLTTLSRHIPSDEETNPPTADGVWEGCEVIRLFFASVFPAGQRILQHQSDVLETVVLVNPSEETAASEVSRNLTAQPEHCRVRTARCSELLVLGQMLSLS